MATSQCKRPSECFRPSPLTKHTSRIMLVSRVMEEQLASQMTQVLCDGGWLLDQRGQEQFDTFTKECLIDRTKSIDDPIHRNKLPLFSTSTRKTSKGKQQLTSLKGDVQLFSRLYIGCQTRDGNLDEFFRHENQSCPPSLSVAGKLH